MRVFGYDALISTKLTTMAAPKTQLYMKFDYCDFFLLLIAHY